MLDLSPRPRTPPAPAPEPSDTSSLLIEMAGAHMFVAAHYLQEKGRSMVCSEVRSFSVVLFSFLFSLLFSLFLSDCIFGVDACHHFYAFSSLIYIYTGPEI